MEHGSGCDLLMLRRERENSRGAGLPSQAVLGTVCRMSVPALPAGLREQHRDSDRSLYACVLFCLQCRPDAFDRKFSVELVGFLSQVSSVLCVTS